MKIFAKSDKRLIWYSVRNQEVQNFVEIFHSDENFTHEDWQTPVDKAALLNRYSDFHSSILAAMKKAKDIKQWLLLFRAPTLTWHKGKLVVIGDAAHPMLPHHAQGGSQAIEDAVALGIVLTNCTPEDLEGRLQLLEKIRRDRASVIQIFSNAGQDEADKIHAEAAKFIPADSVPKTPENFFKCNFWYDVVRDSKQAMKKQNAD